ncbi:hypothetical protein [Oxynema aestuarii]|jgi:gas vesicle protein|uniref:Gas vesicle protein n=1 Tax=Oxynema aestuarii AP17 TaxID=2064643 RepID=A0A6H1TSB1_9CYAN|nr:hypothetical protein [Oxynema aestuarii]QIZ69431.1 hypothetical protein HCG48_01560 [Oxynema aestuarii AP17]RMH73142.1 MAG: hypothetical protein D6680_17460 [Cyanobacteria bacterium J007]
MSNRDNFTGGFIAGAVVGSLIGAALGWVVGSKLSDEETVGENGHLSEGRSRKFKPYSQQSEENIEQARRSLEGKIAQLNEAIDDVRQQLGDVNSMSEQELLESPSRSEEV